VLDVERDAQDATITSFGNALWWAIVTITTVGYGDFTPVTVLGRLIAAWLMVCGIALLSTGAGAVASWLLDRGKAQTQPAGPARANPIAELDELTEEVARLRGAVFEDFENQGGTTLDGVATLDDGKAAWFRDSEGNFLYILQRT